MKVVLMSLIALVSVSAVAESSVYTLPITRNGVTTERVAYNFWSGEWPGPVIRVNSTKKGDTTIKAFKSLRVLSKQNQVACTLKNGVYHPWAQVTDNEVTGKASTQNSVITYYSIVEKNEYLVKKTNTPSWIEMYDESGIELGAPTFKKGSKILVVYGSEGYCLGSTGGKDYFFPCDAIEQDTNYKATTGPLNFDGEQWLYVQCKEGNKAFVQDTSLLAQPGVSQGEFLEYGVAN